MASKITDAITLARLGGATIIHTKQVLAVHPSGTTKILQSFSWPAKEDDFKAPKKAKKKKATIPEDKFVVSEEVI